jgi:hypothetical protein
LQTLEELGLNSLEGWDESISAWVFFGLMDFTCSSCDVFSLIIAPSMESPFPSDFRFVCISCLTQRRFVDYPMAQQSFLTDKFKFIADVGKEKYARDSLRTLNLSKVLFGGLSDKNDSNNLLTLGRPKSFSILERGLRGNEDAPIPQGYRSISWIRFYEAEAIIHTYKSKADFDLKSDAEAVVLKCLYFSDDSEERRKFKANVQAIRVNNQNQRVIGWIRVEEARAVVEANKSRQDLDFVHLKFGNGGKVQFFSEDLEVAKKYRSTTRLLRKD